MPTPNPISHPDTINRDSQIQSPPFSFEDFLTPEYSSENLISEHTTPSPDGLTWEQNYPDPPLHQALNNIRSGQHTGQRFFGNETNDLQGLTSPPTKYFSRNVSGSQLLSPQLTTTPSPPEP